jgi:hypothetical protein
MASDGYSAAITLQALEASVSQRSETVTADDSCDEEFWATVTLPAAASDTVLKLNLLTDPKILIVVGATGVSFKLDSTGTDAIAADPYAVVANEDAGLGIDEILLSNSDASEHTVTVVAWE